MISPTKYAQIRNDSKGKGYYTAPRGNKLHKGVDYICTPGDEIFSPITGIVIRVAKPYAGEEYSGLLIQGSHIAIKLFYFKPTRGLVGGPVNRGDVIGIAQNISKKWGKKMKPHVHLEVTSINPEVLIKMLG